MHPYSNWDSRANTVLLGPQLQEINTYTHFKHREIDQHVFTDHKETRTSRRLELLSLLWGLRNLSIIYMFSECLYIAEPNKISNAYLVAQSVKNLSAIKETRVWALDQADALEKEMATHSSILAWKISWTEEPGRLQLFPGRQQEQLNEYKIITCWTKLLW